MPIGLLSDEEFERELSQKKSAVVVDKASRGRSENDVNVPDSLRKVIADEHLLNGRSAAIDLAKELGISSSSVSAYAKGATSTNSYNSPSKSLISHINKTRERAARKAGKTLNAALRAISQEKLDYTDAKDLSVIAKNMSGIIKDLEPPASSESSGSSQPQFVVFAPQFRKEESFEVIDIQAQEGK